jgi:UDP-N-acetylglucosamine 2-epimerase (non-hydrolysing)
MNITIVAGTRPNFIKIAYIIHALIKCQKSKPFLKFRLVHTGQHYDKRMSGDFFDQLNIPTPDINLESGGGSQVEQTASIIIGFEKELITNKPDVVVVV